MAKCPSCGKRVSALYQLIIAPFRYPSLYHRILLILPSKFIYICNHCFEKLNLTPRGCRSLLVFNVITCLLLLPLLFILKFSISNFLSVLFIAIPISFTSYIWWRYFAELKKVSLK